MNGFRGLTPEDCTEVIDFISDNADDRQLSMRLLGPSLRKLLYARSSEIDWRPLVKSQLQTLGRKNDASKRLDTREKDGQVLKAIIQRFPDSVNDQQLHWCKATGKSRASFYRCRKRYLDETA